MTSLLANNNNATAVAAFAYIFVCNAKTEARCLQGLLGSPSRDFKKLKDTINDNTLIFLFNFSSNKLFGPFRKHGQVKMNIDSTAWTGEKQGKQQPIQKKKSRFPAQVQIKSWASKKNFLTSATPVRVTDKRVIPKGGGAIMQDTKNKQLKNLLESQKQAAEIDPDGMILKQYNNGKEAIVLKQTAAETTRKSNKKSKSLEKGMVSKQTNTIDCSDNNRQNITLKELREQRDVARTIAEAVKIMKKGNKKKKSAGKEISKLIGSLPGKTQNLLIKQMQELSLLHGTLHTPVVLNKFQKTFSLKEDDVPHYFSWFDGQKCKFAWFGSACKFGNKCKYIHPLSPTKSRNSKNISHSTSLPAPKKMKPKQKNKKEQSSTTQHKNTKKKEKRKHPGKKTSHKTPASHLGNGIAMMAIETTTEDNFEDKIGSDVEYDQENSVAIIGELKEMFHDGYITMNMFEEALQELVEEKAITTMQLKLHVNTLINKSANKSLLKKSACKSAPTDSKQSGVAAFKKKKETTWQCPSCTFENVRQDSKCNMCLRINPEILIKNAKEKLNHASNNKYQNNNLAAKKNSAFISRMNNNNPQMFKASRSKKKQDPVSTKVGSEAMPIVPKGCETKKVLSAKQLQTRMYNRRQELIRQNHKLRSLKKKYLKKMIEDFNEPARKKRREKLKFGFAKMVKHRNSRVVQSSFTNWKKLMESDDFLALKRKRQEEEAKRFAEEEEEMKRELELKRAKLKAAEIAAEEKEKQRLENRRKKREARVRRRKEKRENTAKSMLPLLYATCIANVESVLEENAAFSNVFQLFVTSNQALEASYQQMVIESEKAEEFLIAKAEIESKNCQATLIHFNAGLLCADLLEIFQLAYQYRMAQNSNKNRKRDSNNNNERFLPKYRIECYLMELNKVVDFELTYTEFEELMEVSESDVPTRMATIKFIIKKRRQEEKRIAELKQKEAIAAEKKRIQELKEAKEKQRLQEQRRKERAEQRRRYEIEEEERRQRVKEAKARAKAARRERKRRQHQYFDFDDDFDVFFEYMFQQRFAGRSTFNNFFFSGFDEEFGGRDYYDYGEDNSEKLKEKKKAAFELFELPDDAPEADVNRAYKRMALRYHPDKWSERLGISKEEGIEKFKAFTNARDNIIAYNNKFGDDAF